MHANRPTGTRRHTQAHRHSPPPKKNPNTQNAHLVFGRKELGRLLGERKGAGEGGVKQGTQILGVVEGVEDIHVVVVHLQRRADVARNVRQHSRRLQVRVAMQGGKTKGEGVG